MAVEISKVEYWCSDFHSEYCVMIYVDGSKEANARIDNGKVSFFYKTLGTKISGLDEMMKNTRLENFKTHPKAVRM